MLEMNAEAMAAQPTPAPGPGEGHDLDAADDIRTWAQSRSALGGFTPAPSRRRRPSRFTCARGRTCARNPWRA